MPNVSISTITRTDEKIGMGLVLTSIRDASTKDIKLTRSIHDADEDCCSCFSTSTDTDQNNEAVLVSQYPEFSGKINELIEARRQRLAASQNSRCTVL